MDYLYWSEVSDPKFQEMNSDFRFLLLFEVHLRGFLHYQKLQVQPWDFKRGYDLLIAGYV